MTLRSSRIHPTKRQRLRTPRSRLDGIFRLEPRVAIAPKSAPSDGGGILATEDL